MLKFDIEVRGLMFFDFSNRICFNELKFHIFLKP